MNYIEDLCVKAKKSSYNLSALTALQKNEMLRLIAKEILANKQAILVANKEDIINLNGRDTTFLDRLTLTDKRIENMCEGLEQIAEINDPIGEVTEEWTNKDGLKIRKIRMPLGVIGVIYEARPNVTIDVAGLCIKTGNAVVLKGGSDALNSNRILYNCIKNALESKGYDSNIVQFIDSTDRNSTMEMLAQSNNIDVIIPRGGNSLKKLVLENSTIPIIASAGGNCHIYIDESADLNEAVKVIVNAKVQRPSVCNACEQLLINTKIAGIAVPMIFNALKEQGVTIKGDEICRKYSDCDLASEEDYYTEHQDLVISVKCVENTQEAIDWTNEHSTSHSEAILSKNEENIALFTTKVDSGCVYVNASTRFTDGFEFGFGAEIGISTQKLHARGPLGPKQLTSEKYIIVGKGTCRK